ncbi:MULTISPECIES: 30S ribosomal protein S16 [Fusobacterium]|jgi:ribosomal protein S16|uniref:30S ribosomal protein S16 n=2 Tax=Fusobacteriaceae TaxID=203492 RepID=UPI00093E50BD|nr:MULTISPECIES: 30S ribosomal protein S16 [Fusobacterium]MDD7392524.1 30S ribosomal protein S16 [Fusobacteriaceae bacterium]MCI5725773.1 30S ribosomal protein S16 [Fusobacterium sp.]MCI7223405.1 30S ribosomal protein S16 [Fusobacterium sp.]MDD7410612.1 30S ribosomal protein S16 [Fusobacteriaceae bacterium]MDY5305331.1 30S ribosomal protein S16 [Fusobacterium gastrosuis]
MLKLRLTRLGDKKRPSYRLVAMEALSKRDGGAVAYLGNYFPLEDSKVVLKEEEILKFLQNGAQPTRTVKSILDKAGIWAKFEASKKK